ncbi:MAG: hypothetical protein KGJ40_00805 [candidate division NC10 bacterium]|nr:hypothetical protein [candidate division NC10 bacterium]MDE2484048.1 hypothetical protein [candidate division NC10 bacterium]
MVCTLKTVNTDVSKESSYGKLLRPNDFLLPPSIPNWTDDQVVTFPQKTPIPDSGLSLRYTLIAEIRATRDGFVLRSGDLDEDAFGLTYEEAYLGFLTSLRDRYYSLVRREASLSRQDHSVLEKLRRLLAKG